MVRIITIATGLASVLALVEAEQLYPRYAPFPKHIKKRAVPVNSTVTVETTVVQTTITSTAGASTSDSGITIPGGIPIGSSTDTSKTTADPDTTTKKTTLPTSITVATTTTEDDPNPIGSLTSAAGSVISSVTSKGASIVSSLTDTDTATTASPTTTDDTPGTSVKTTATTDQTTSTPPNIISSVVSVGSSIISSGASVITSIAGGPQPSTTPSVTTQPANTNPPPGQSTTPSTTDIINTSIVGSITSGAGSVISSVTSGAGSVISSVTDSPPVSIPTTTPSIPVTIPTTTPSIPISVPTTTPSLPIGGTTTPSLPIGGTTTPSLPVGGTTTPSLPVGGTTTPSLPVGGTTTPSLPVGGTTTPSLPVGGTTTPSLPVGGTTTPSTASSGTTTPTSPGAAGSTSPSSVSSSPSASLASSNSIVVPPPSSTSNSPAAITGPTSIKPTATDTLTTQSMPNTVIFDTTASTASSAAVTSTGIPSNLPGQLQNPFNGGQIPQPPSNNATLCAFAFNKELNFRFVSQDNYAIREVFYYTPKAIIYGLNYSADSNNVVMHTLRPYDTSANGYITTLAYFYMPDKDVDNLQAQLIAANSWFHQGKSGDNQTDTFITLIDPSYPLRAANLNLPGNPAGATPTGSSGGDPANLNSGGSASASSSSVNPVVVGASIGSIAACCLYGFLMYTIAKRYKKHRGVHSRSSSVIDTSSMAQSHGEMMTGAGSALMSGHEGYYGTNGRTSRESGSSRGMNQISQPINVESSLGWS